MLSCVVLTYKESSKTAAEDTCIVLLLYFEENKAWCFMWLLYLGISTKHFFEGMQVVGVANNCLSEIL